MSSVDNNERIGVSIFIDGTVKVLDSEIDRLIKTIDLCYLAAKTF